jgi:glycosyltransferase involved in cell wall biosynthesis
VARVIWHSCAPWSPSGYGTQTAIWAQELVKMGHEVFISTFWGLNGSATQWNGITVLPGFGSNYSSPSLQQHARHLNPDLVITLGDVWVLDPNVLRELPVACWLPADCRPMSTADRNVAEAAGSALIAMSRFGEERFRDAGFRDPLYVPHGIDTGLFRPAADKAAMRAKCGLGDDAFVIGVNAANNDAIRKAAPEMMLAFAKFARNHPEAVLSVHAGVHQDGGQDLECLAENLGITDMVRVVDQYRYAAGLVGLDDLAEWYGALDVLLASTYAEGFGIPVVEALSCGVPVITTRCSSMTELNPDGIEVDGEPFWNGVHRAWWIRPSVSGMVAALEQAYDQRHDVDPVKLREQALKYDIAAVSERHMRPVVDELLERMAAKKAGV